MKLHYSRSLTLVGLALALLASVRAEETTSTIKFSDPSKPGTVKIAVARGDLHIRGGNDAAVVIKSEAQSRSRPARKDGLRVLTEAASFSLSEKDNVITLDAVSDGWMGSPADFHITVPTNTSIAIANSYGGDITCAAITGDVEIKSMNGQVRLEDLAGGTLVETMNGEIKATVRELHDNKPLSFSSMNGEVQLRLASDAKANIRLRTQNGTIATDFDAKALVTQVESAPSGWQNSRKGMHVFTPEIREAIRDAARAGAEVARQAAEAAKEAADAAREGLDLPDDDSNAARKHAPARLAKMPKPPAPPTPPIPTVTGGKLVTGTLNGGGTEINVATMNGDVTIRRIDHKE